MTDTLGIYLIKRDPLDATYEEAWGFVVAAVDEETARAIIAASERHGGEGPAPWLDSRQSAAEMVGRSLPGDPPRIVLRDFHAG
jgi:hypothetical protein